LAFVHREEKIEQEKGKGDVYVRWRREEGLQNYFWVGSFTIAVIIGGTPHNSSS